MRFERIEEQKRFYIFDFYNSEKIVKSMSVEFVKSEKIWYWNDQGNALTNLDFLREVVNILIQLNGGKTND